MAKINIKEEAKEEAKPKKKPKGTAYSCTYPTVRKKTGTTYSPKH